MTSFTHKTLDNDPLGQDSVWVFAILSPVLFGIVFVFALFSDFLPTYLGAYADQRFLQAAVMLGVSLVCLRSVSPSSSFTDLWLGIRPVLPIVAGFILLAVPFANNPYNWVEPGLFSLFFFTFAVLGWRIVERSAVGVVTNLFIFLAAVACFLYAAMTMTVYLFAIIDRFASLTDIIPWGFVNMRYWSHLATWLLPLLPLAAQVGPLAQKRKWRWGVGFAAAIWWWVVFMTMARGTMISFFVACLIVGLVFRKQILAWLRIFLSHLLLGLIAWAVLSVVIPGLLFEEVAVRSLHAGSAGRLPLWQEAWIMSLANFPWGQGPQSWLTHELILSTDSVPKRFGHPHNMYLMWAAEYGWLLVFCLLFLVCVVFKKLFNRLEAVRGSVGQASTLAAFSVASIAGFAHAGVSAVFIVPASMLVGLCVLGLYWALLLERKVPAKRAAETGQKEQAWIFHGLFLALLVAGAIWTCDVWRYHQAMVEDLVGYEQGPAVGTFPRFWFHGNFPRPD